MMIQIKAWAANRKKLLLATSIVGVLILLVVVPQESHAFLSTVAGVINSILYAIGGLIASGLMKLLQAFITLLTVVLDFSEYASEPYVLTGWSLIRDLVNLGFVLVLIAIALMSILQITKNAVRSLLPKLIAGVLLVNLSLFIADQILRFADSITGVFIGLIQTASSTLFEFAKPENFTNLENYRGTPDIEAVIAVWLLAFFVFLLLAAFLALIVAMLIRIVGIMALLTFAPATFLLMILPATQGLAKKWWKTFLGFAFWGPAATFFVWLAIITMASDQSALNNAFDATDIPIGESIGVSYSELGKFIIATIYLTAAIAIGKMFAGNAANLSMKAFDKGKAFGGNILKRTPGFSAAYNIPKAIGSKLQQNQKNAEEKNLAKWQDRTAAAGAGLGQLAKGRPVRAAGVFAARWKAAPQQKRLEAKARAARKDELKNLDDEERAELFQGGTKGDKQAVAELTAEQGGDLRGLDSRLRAGNLQQGLIDQGFSKNQAKKLAKSLSKKLAGGKNHDVTYAGEPDEVGGGLNGDAVRQAFAGKTDNPADFKTASNKLIRDRAEGDDGSYDDVGGAVEVEALAQDFAIPDGRGGTQSFGQAIGGQARAKLKKSKFHQDFVNETRSQIAAVAAGNENDPIKVTVGSQSVTFANKEAADQYVNNISSL